MAAAASSLFSDPDYPQFQKGHILTGTNKFELEGYISHGSYGVVYFGKEVTTRLPVAIKVSRIFQEESEGRVNNHALFSKLIIEEAELYDRINKKVPNELKKHFLEIKELVQSQCPKTRVKVQCLVMEKFGQNLEDLPYKLSIDKIRIIANQIFKTIAFLHSIRFVHCDLNTRNVLVDEKTWNTKIIDFGFSSFVGHRRILSICSSWYAPPEVIEKRKPFTNAIDIWPVGCIIGRICTKKFIFPPEDFDKKIAAFMQAGASPLQTDADFEGRVIQSPELLLTSFFSKNMERFDAIQHRDFIHLMTRILETNPAKRITAPNALTHPFFSFPRQLDGTTPLPYKTVFRIGNIILEELLDLHSSRTYFGPLEPCNIALVREGTEEYRLYNPSPSLDESTWSKDMYSFGCTLIILLKGQAYFDHYKMQPYEVRMKAFYDDLKALVPSEEFETTEKVIDAIIAMLLDEPESRINSEWALKYFDSF